LAILKGNPLELPNPPGVYTSNIREAVNASLKHPIEYVEPLNTQIDGITPDAMIQHLIASLNHMIVSVEPLNDKIDAFTPDAMVGIPVSIRAVDNLKFCAYYLKHTERVQRKPVANAIKLVLVRSYHDQQWHEASFNNTSEEPVINNKDWTRALEQSRSTSPSSMEELGIHWIMLCGRTLKSRQKLRTLQMDMKLWIKK
jgi:hypothetical protein